MNLKSVERAELPSERQKPNRERECRESECGITASSMESMLKGYRHLIKIIVSKMRTHLPTYVDLQELESAGLVGLIAAVQKFDASRGYTFETYASVRIRGAILDELRSMDWMPRSARTKSKKMNAAVQDLEQRLGRVPTDEEIRTHMGIDGRQFRKLRRDSAPLNVLYLDRTHQDDELNLHDIIADDRLVPSHEALEKSELIDLMKDRILELPERQRKILTMYYREGMRLAEIAGFMGVSEARISQMRTQTLRSLRLHLNHLINY